MVTQQRRLSGSNLSGGHLVRIPRGKPLVGHGLFRIEVQKLLVERRMAWVHLVEAIKVRYGKEVRPTIYKVRSGTYAAGPRIVDWIIEGFGQEVGGVKVSPLTQDDRRRLHVAAALDFGFRLGG